MKSGVENANYKHGHAIAKPTLTYRAWAGLFTRCYNKRSRGYPAYGGRGIRVCDRWQIFENFLADMGEKPKGLSLDRKDNNKGYSPDNCQWATKREQAINRRSTLWIERDGIKMCALDWAKHLNIPPTTIYTRISLGLSLEKILTNKPRN